MSRLPHPRLIWMAACGLTAALTVPHLSAQNPRPLSHGSAPPLQEQVLAAPLLSGGAIRAEIELLPTDVYPVLNGAPANPQTAHDTADARIVAQVRFTGAGILGAHTGGETVPYLGVSATVTNERTNEALVVALRPTVGLEEGWHYSSNVKFPGSVTSDMYRVRVRLTPPSALRTEPDFAVSGTLLDSAAEIEIRGVRVNLQQPPAPGSFPTTVREGLSS